MKTQKEVCGWIAVGMLAVVVGLAGSAEAAKPSPARVPAQSSGTEAAVISQTNAARARQGLPPLATDSQLMQGARNHAHWMASNNNLAHGSGVTENIGMGQTSAGEIVNNWMNSPGHRSNILDGSLTRIGVAVAYSSNGTPYWCQQFR
jgi:uncharacterized protein YkwD